MIKAYLSRVGADKGNLGCLGPLFKDYSFEFIPIKESLETVEDRTYRTIEGRSGHKLSVFIPNSKRNLKPHFDPEFETFTYGDPTTDRTKFLKLNKGDILLFYAGLDPVNFKRKTNEGSCYFIGYITVDSVIDFHKEKRIENVLNNYPQLFNNAHIKRCQIQYKLRKKDKFGWPVSLVYKSGDQPKKDLVDMDGNIAVKDFDFREYLDEESPGFYENEGCDIYIEPDLVVVIGDQKKSRLLEKAIPFTKPGENRIGREIAYVSKEIEQLLGIHGLVQRKKGIAKTARVIQGSDYIENLKELLDY